jgi:signal transduction histidine kinase
MNEIEGLLESTMQNSHGTLMITRPLESVRGHRTTLIQALSNLVSNAFKFVEPGTAPVVRIWSERRAGWVRVSVQDNGIGMAPEHHERIFEIFQRLHGPETYPGTGIGLAIVKKSMERMGGRFGVESSLGNGSRFWVELPEVDE